MVYLWVKSVLYLFFLSLTMKSFEIALAVAAVGNAKPADIDSVIKELFTGLRGK